jgi:hypothetical protein
MIAVVYFERIGDALAGLEFSAAVRRVSARIDIPARPPFVAKGGLSKAFDRRRLVGLALSALEIFFDGTAVVIFAEPWIIQSL